MMNMHTVPTDIIMHIQGGSQRATCGGWVVASGVRIATGICPPSRLRRSVSAAGRVSGAGWATGFRSGGGRDSGMRRLRSNAESLKSTTQSTSESSVALGIEPLGMLSWGAWSRPAIDYSVRQSGWRVELSCSSQDARGKEGNSLSPLFRRRRRFHAAADRGGCRCAEADEGADR